MMAFEAIAKNTSPYDDGDIQILMDYPEFKKLPHEVQSLAQKVFILAQSRATGIESKLPWPPEMLTDAALLHAGDRGNVRFITPFSFLIHLEEDIVKARRTPKQ